MHRFLTLLKVYSTSFVKVASTVFVHVESVSRDQMLNVGDAKVGTVFQLYGACFVYGVLSND